MNNKHIAALQAIKDLALRLVDQNDPKVGELTMRFDCLLEEMGEVVAMIAENQKRQYAKKKESA